MTGPVALRARGSGRQSAAAESLWAARADLDTLNSEVIDFVDAAWPHLSALERMAAELGPIALRHALALGSLLARLETRHTAPDEESAEIAA